jgi:hypothetical protein
MAGATVPLSRVYSEGSRRLESLSFRLPRWQDYVELGDIEEWQPVDPPGTENPRMMLVRHADVVARYAERCVEAPASSADLAALDLPDTVAVHKAIRGFFTTSVSSEAKPTASSGATEKDSAKSAD